MNNKIVIKNREPQEIKISGGGDVVGITNVYVNGIDVTEGNVAYVIVPTKLSELQNNMGFITQETDPTVPYYVKQITQADINKWNNKQDLLVSGTNIKTINGNSIMGSGNLVIDTSYTAGTGIEITEENVINNIITSYNDLSDLPTIPTQTSELLNDSGYVTSEELSEVAFDGSYTSLSNTPTVVSDFINDANYVDMSFIWNMLPKLTDTDSTINLTPTVLNAPIKIELNPSTLSQDGTPTPSSPETIHSTTGSNTIVVRNAQLFDKSTALTDKLVNASNGNVGNDTGTTASDYIHINGISNIILSGTTVSYTNGGAFYDENKTYVSGFNSASIKNGIAIPSNAYYVRFNTLNTKVDTTMLNEGTTALTYQEYNSTDYSVNLGNIEYCKISTYADRIFKNVSSDPDYDDTLDEGDWYIKKNIGKVVLDGTENWGQNTAQTLTNTSLYYTPLIDSTLNVSQAIKSNYFNYTQLWSTDIEGIYGYSGSNALRIRINTSTASDTDEFKTWLSNNNTIVYYVLNTPTYTKITDDDLILQLENIQIMKTYNEQTNISQINADLPFQITAETVKSLVNE